MIYLYESTHELAINKLIILSLIYQTGMPLSTSEITDFVTLNNFAEYFSVQQYIADLTSSEFLDKYEENHKTYYNITEDGKKTLEMFSTQIPQYIKEVIFLYVNQNSKKLKNDREIKAEYFPEKSNEFSVKCSITENDTTLLSIVVNVPSKEQAKLICDNWKNNSSYIYGSVFQSLTQTKAD